MRRLLMVAYYFPPLGGIGALRALKFATYLPEHGWEVTVLAPRDGAYYRDPSLSFPEARVVRTASIELSRLGKRGLRLGGSDTDAARVGPATGRLRALARRLLYRPDAQVGWLPFAVRAGRQELQRRRYDAVLSSSFPITAHVVARRLAREFGVPWVAEFRDPWIEAMLPEAPGRGRAERLEAGLLASAQALVLPSPGWAELFARKGASNVRVITNGYDPRDLSPPQPPEHFVLTHVGSFYPERQTLNAVLSGLASLRAEGALSDPRLRFVGEPPRSLIDEIGRWGLQGAVEATGFVPYREAIDAMLRSSALLVAGARDDRPSFRGLIPAKVFDYLASTLPVIHAGDTDTDVARLLAAHPGCYVFAADDVEAARAALRAVATRTLWPRDLTGLSRQEQAGQLAALLDEVSA